MPFNSFDFIFIFLPCVVISFYFLSKNNNQKLLILHLLVSSLLFYSWWNINMLWLLVSSIVVNFMIFNFLISTSNYKFFLRKSILIFGIIFNLSLIFFYKYFDFGVSITNSIFETNFLFVNLYLPLGISFFTFQQISTLIDAWGNKCKNHNIIEYGLFVAFFPQLIAGPIIRYDEFFPQIKNKIVFTTENISIGLTFFIIGLFKKIVIADNLAVFVNPVFISSDSGSDLLFIDTWGASLAFTFQLYFDISGYADMAIGLGRMFGIKIPLNFNSPFKAKSIIDYWQRWHLTLTRFLQGYLYNPIVVSITRKRMQKKKALYNLKFWSWGGYFHLLLFPTVLTMTIAGLWHGAGYTFVLFGFLHGIFLSLNHVFRYIMNKIVLNETMIYYVNKLYVLLTLVLITILNVPFRASSIDSTILIWKSMFGFNGIVLPEEYLTSFELVKNTLTFIGIKADSSVPIMFLGSTQLMWLLSALFICWFLPNTQQIMSNYIDGKKNINFHSLVYSNIQKTNKFLTWKPDFSWLIIVLFLSISVINSLSDTAEFLYFRF